MARASRESLRTGVAAVKGGAMAVWDSWGAGVARTAVAGNGSRVCTLNGADRAPRRFCPDADPFESEVCNVPSKFAPSDLSTLDINQEDFLSIFSL